MKKFKNSSKLEQATIGVIVNQLVSKDERKELLKQFQDWDKNGDDQTAPRVYPAGVRLRVPGPLFMEECPADDIAKISAQGVHNQIVHIRCPERKQLYDLNCKGSEEACQQGAAPGSAFFP